MACVPCKSASKKPPAPVPAASEATGKVVDANAPDGAAAASPDTSSAQPDAIDAPVLPDKATDEASSQLSEASSDHNKSDDELPDKSESLEPAEWPHLQSPSFCPWISYKSGCIRSMWQSPYSGKCMFSNGQEDAGLFDEALLIKSFEQCLKNFDGYLSKNQKK
jgi:hypothetical protein